MSITAERKQELIGDYGAKKGDTGKRKTAKERAEERKKKKRR